MSSALPRSNAAQRQIRGYAGLLLLIIGCLAVPGGSSAQEQDNASGEVTLDFTDVELPVVIDTIENATAKTAKRRSTRGKRPKSSTSDLP